MQKILLSLIFLFFFNISFSQVAVDLKKSVPFWFEYDTTTNNASLKWINDDLANTYVLNELNFSPLGLSPIDTLEGSMNEVPLGELASGETYNYLMKKDFVGEGVITLGLEVPAVHDRGRCLIAIDDTLALPLQIEIEQLIIDLTMDGWEVDTLNIPRTTDVVAVKSMVVDWHDENYEASQTLFILGHIAVPYSGNSAHDGHSNHQGSWAADVFYGDVDGNWTDQTVNNTTPSRSENKNIPGDGKYDQTLIPSQVEIEIGRVDFHNLPAFPDDEIELTRQYLIKNHEFKIGDKDYPRRALVENNFSSFDEGFGQSGWRNFTTMFGGDSVSIQDYNTVLENDKYLCSYACGGGSYTSCSGVGTTNNLWVAKDIKTVFTMTFGSYFGDWDSQNNFLRAALASGDVLTNTWAGRPVWQLYPMSLGQHIGFCAKESQNATGFIYNLGFSSRSAHMALMGDPTLRLHAVKTANNLTADFMNGDINLSWENSPHASHGYFIYKKINNEDWELIEEFYSSNNYVDPCALPNTDYEFMVKAIRLEHTGSGTYFNTSLGISTAIQINENPAVSSYFADTDMDGFGNSDDEILACSAPTGFVGNDLDCDDTNNTINPNASEIPNNGIDEDCDGADLMVGVHELGEVKIRIFPNPTKDWIFVKSENFANLNYRIFNAHGQVIKSGLVPENINLSNISSGLYWLEINSVSVNQSIVEKILIQK